MAVATANRPMKTSNRTESLRGLVDHFLREHELWAHPSSNRPQYLDDRYWDRLDDMIEGFSAGDIPGECRRIADAVTRLDLQAQEHDLQLMENAYAIPRDDFWSAVEALRLAREDRGVADLMPLESVELLNQQGVDHVQIAKIYGFVNARGIPDTKKVEEELKKTGCHTGPGTGWVDPRVLERQREQEAASRNFQAARERRAPREQTQQEPAPKPCPETIEELIDQDVDDEQIARMHRVPIDEVRMRRAARKDPAKVGMDRETAAMLNPIELPPDRAGVEDSSAAPENEEVDEDEEGDFTQPEDAGDIDAQIVGLAAEGWKHDEIAQQLGITSQKVGAVIRAERKRRRAGQGEE